VVAVPPPPKAPSGHLSQEGVASALGYALAAVALAIACLTYRKGAYRRKAPCPVRKGHRKGHRRIEEGECDTVTDSAPWRKKDKRSRRGGPEADGDIEPDGEDDLDVMDTYASDAVRAERVHDEHWHPPPRSKGANVSVF